MKVNFLEEFEGKDMNSKSRSVLSVLKYLLNSTLRDSNLQIGEG